MMQLITSLYPKVLWKHFYDLTQIPRPSKHEHKAIEHVIAFAQNKGLTFKTDKAGNVVIIKPATPGMENRVPVVLQAHLDMVPQQNSGNQHNFFTDPLQPRVVDGWVMATDTTLGADNGIGAAAILAVLEDSEIPHGPIEALFTVDEETGMGGARTLSPDWLRGRIFINTDSEDEGELFVGCAGAANACCRFIFEREKIPANMTGYQISITGLKGGHSGLDIHRGRANANKLLFRVIKRLVAAQGCYLSEVNGGSLRNAIPREAFATVAVPNDNIPHLQLEIDRLKKSFITEYGHTEPEMQMTITPTTVTYIMDPISQDDLINAIQACPNGVIRMSDTMHGVVETSTNLAVVQTQNNEVMVISLVRSFIDSAKDDVCSSIDSLFKLAGARVWYEGGYPGWKPNPNSTILSVMKEVYKKHHGQEPAVKAIHAGLECGILSHTYPHWDMISFGPTIRFPHSPDEKVNIESVGRFWDYLVETLRSIPVEE
ncbi:MAG: aminoacyl-histidine dipeptidase [Marinilabiliaceae bacterium]|nr:aminoacyl-histidine dipeptidase [Marinilabiliaceae bacterium]